MIDRSNLNVCRFVKTLVVTTAAMAAMSVNAADPTNTPPAGGANGQASIPTAPATASDTTDKWQYDLFHPTPVALMRAFDSDRPSKTDVPFTVDAGHFQLETDFANYTHDDKNGVRDNTLEIASTMNLKAGLLNNVDAQIIFGNYVRQDILDRNTGARVVDQGFGDTTFRLKVNLFGDDGGEFALALMPYVKFPTDTGSAGNHSFEGGLNVPFAANLPWGFTLNAEITPGIVRNDDNSGYHAAFNNSAILYHGIEGKLSGYAEIFSSVSSRARDAWIGTADFGLIYQLTPNLAFDVDTAIGVTRSAPDFNIFGGIAVRF